MKEAIKVDYKSEVLKTYPSAIAKHWMHDNGHGYSAFWVISKRDSTRYEPTNDISRSRLTANAAWKSAYEQLTTETPNP